MTTTPGRRRGRPRTEPGPPPAPSTLTITDLACVLAVLTGARPTPPSARVETTHGPSH